MSKRVGLFVLLLAIVLVDVNCGTSDRNVQAFIDAKADSVFSSFDTSEVAYAHALRLNGGEIESRVTEQGMLYYGDEGFVLCKVEDDTYSMKYNYNDLVYERVVHSNNEIQSLRIWAIKNDCIYYEVKLGSGMVEYYSFFQNKPTFRIKYDAYEY